jgi:hypothetical protein
MMMKQAMGESTGWVALAAQAFIDAYAMFTCAPLVGTKLRSRTSAA